jgi:hypothetical protein
MGGQPWRLVAGGVTLREQFNARWPNRDKRSDGSIADGNHDPASFHQPDAQGFVRAIDLDEDLDPADRKAMWRVMNELAEHCRRGEPGSGRILHIVYEDQVASGTPGKGHPDYWRFRGSGYSHFHHAHISFTDAARYDARPFPLPSLEDDMPLSDDDVKRIAKAVWQYQFGTGWQNDGTFDRANPVTITALTAVSDARGTGRRAVYQGTPTTDEASIADAVVDEVAGRLAD